MSTLAQKKCVPCERGVPPLKGEALAALAKEVPGWKVVKEHHLEKTFPFPDFRKALDFVNLVGDVADKEGHHPDIQLGWGKAAITILTHAINGLSENDFILAAKIDALQH